MNPDKEILQLELQIEVERTKQSQERTKQEKESTKQEEAKAKQSLGVALQESAKTLQVISSSTNEAAAEGARQVAIVGKAAIETSAQFKEVFLPPGGGTSLSPKASNPGNPGFEQISLAGAKPWDQWIQEMLENVKDKIFEIISPTGKLDKILDAFKNLKEHVSRKIPDAVQTAPAPRGRQTG